MGIDSLRLCFGLYSAYTYPHVNPEVLSAFWYAWRVSLDGTVVPAVKLHPVFVVRADDAQQAMPRRSPTPDLPHTP